MENKENKFRQAIHGQWGERKKSTAIMLTPTASQKLNVIGNNLDLSRSEVIERLIRAIELNSIDALLNISGVK